MVDTLEQIYMNQALGSTELSDGEHTLLTTDANTSYVIKDMNVINSSNFTNTYLSLNGFKVGGLSSNATGSLIIPPNSTLKIETADYPVSIKQVKIGATHNTTLAFSVYYEDSLGNKYLENSMELTGITSATNMTDFTLTNANNGNTYLHYVVSDKNSTHQTYYKPIESSTNSTVLTSRSYSVMGLHDNKVYFFNNSALVYIDLLTYPTSDSPGNPIGNYNPYTTSSYPRGFASHGFYWYVPNNSYTTNIYAINLSNGKWHSFDLSTSATGAGTNMTSNNSTFGISVDEANDKLYIYWPPSSVNYILQTTYATSWSNIVASSVAGLTSHIAVTNKYQLITGNSFSKDNMGSTNLGNTSDGGFTYKSLANELVFVDKDLKVTETRTGGVGTYPSPNGMLVAKTSRVSLAQASLLGLALPTFGVQLLGVKSEA